MRCTATTKQGTPCQNRPMAGHEVCQPHSGGQVGRRSKLTDDLEREILDAVRAGSYLPQPHAGPGSPRRPSTSGGASGGSRTLPLAWLSSSAPRRRRR